MIRDVPEAAEFDEVGRSLLNFAYDHLIKLVTLYYDYVSHEDSAEERAEFWAGAKTALIPAIVLAQQAREMLLKAKIASHHPMLLVVHRPQQWGSKGFGDLKTHDAQDLIALHDGLSEQPLPPEFSKHFNMWRELRNRVTHSVDKSNAFLAEDLIGSLIEAADFLIGPRQWGRLRLSHHLTMPGQDHLDSNGGPAVVLDELAQLERVLAPEAFKRLIGFDTKGDRFLCPNCNFMSPNEGHKFMQRVTGAELTRFFCFACSSQVDGIAEKQCMQAECTGGVFFIGRNYWGDGEYCLVCGHF